MPNKDFSTIEQKVYELVKAKIVDLEWKPSQFVSDLEIAAEMGISRTPVRDAFRRLEYERLLTRQSRKGWQVVPLTIDDVREIFTLKELLQGRISYQAAACQNIALRAELASVTEQMRVCNENNSSLEEWEGAHIRFHEILSQMADLPNERMNEILSQLNAQWSRVRRGMYAIPSYRERETSGHVEIARAVLDTEPETAERLTRAHVRSVSQEVMQLLEHLVFPFLRTGI